MDDFNKAKKDILKCLGMVAESIIELPNCPAKAKITMIIGELYEIMRKLSDMTNE